MNKYLNYNNNQQIMNKNYLMKLNLKKLKYHP